ncbi:MAG: HdeD family acid-resistance protein [Gemmataceae bacterium]
MSERDGFPTLPESQGNGRWFLILGVALILLGVVELGSVAVRELLAILVLGPLLIASGILQILLAFFSRRQREAPLHLVAAALDLVMGFLVVVHPHNTVDDLILVLASFLMLGGVSRILSSVLLRYRSWGWIVGAGIVAVILGLVVWHEDAFRRLWLVGACVAADFISHGVSWVILSTERRKGIPKPSTSFSREP